MNEKHKNVLYLMDLVSVLRTATDMQFMLREHAQAIWKQELKEAGITIAPVKTPLKTVVKK